ncbi:MAG: hypothetical protein Q4A54_02855 [Parabacteroides sp.]|nr:hypothetical protein [Parabacteroides sp.]
MNRLPILILSLLTITHLIGFSQSQKNKGYPERGETLDVLPGFQQRMDSPSAISIPILAQIPSSIKTDTVCMERQSRVNRLYSRKHGGIFGNGSPKNVPFVD